MIRSRIYPVAFGLYLASRCQLLFHRLLLEGILTISSPWLDEGSVPSEGFVLACGGLLALVGFVWDFLDLPFDSRVSSVHSSSKPRSYDLEHLRTMSVEFDHT